MTTARSRIRAARLRERRRELALESESRDSATLTADTMAATARAIFGDGATLTWRTADEVAMDATTTAAPETGHDCARNLREVGRCLVCGARSTP